MNYNRERGKEFLEELKKITQKAKFKIQEERLQILSHRKKEAEKNLNLSEEKFRRMFEDSGIGMAIVSLKGQYVKTNKSFCNMLGYSEKELLEKNIKDITLPEDYSKDEEEIKKIIEGNIKQVFIEKRYIHKEGHIIYGMIHGTVVRNDENNPVFMIGQIQNITEKKLAEEKLKQSEYEVSIINDIAKIFLTTEGKDTYRNVLNRLTDALQSSWGVMGFINKNTEKSITKYIWNNIELKEVKFTPSNDSMESIYKNVLLNGKHRCENKYIPVPEGHIILERAFTVPLIYGDKPVGFITLANKQNDYTDKDIKLLESISNFISPILYERLKREKAEKEREELERKLLHARKMEAIGTLAGGISHDFNNILMAIMGYAGISLDNAKKGSELYSNLIEIIRVSERGAEMVKKILTFSKKIEEKKLPVKVYPSIEEAINLIKSFITPDIQIVTDIKEKDIAISGDHTGLYQIFTNLFINACHAMKNSGGILSISLERVHMSTEGTYVKITVKDTGYGMDKDTAERIFEPYFTTKAQGEGTGLGLSIVHGITGIYGGEISVKSEKGKGTCFEIILPESQIEEDKCMETSALEPEAHDEKIYNSKEDKGHILFVDDEEDIVFTASHILKKFGYRVTGKNNSSDALRLFKENQEIFDLVITDYCMPCLTGINLAEEILKIKPSITVILSTGVKDFLDKEKIKETGIKECIAKPYSIRELSETVRKFI